MEDNLYNQFLDMLRKICPINEELASAINQVIVLQKLPKGAHLTTIGGVANKLFYIANGLVRGYYYVNGKEVTSWIAAERNFAFSVPSFLKQEPSFENIELLEDSQLFFISYADLQLLYASYPVMNLMGRTLSEKHLIALDERIHALRMLNAEERYYRFYQRYPEICARTPLKHIASYLGLSRFTLSRLRSQKIKPRFRD